jgi:hypothetical protein
MTTPKHGIWPQWCCGRRGRHRSDGAWGNAKEKGRAFTPTKAWHPRSTASQSCYRRCHHCSLPPAWYECQSVPHWRWPLSGTARRARRGTERLNSQPAARGRHGGAASPHPAAHRSLGLACRRCLPNGKWWPYHVVRRAREAKAARSPRAGIVVITKRARGFLLCKVLPLMLELCLGSLQVYLPSAQAVCLLRKVGHAAVGTLVRWHELGCLLRPNFTIDVVAHARRVIVVNVIGVIL